MAILGGLEAAASAIGLISDLKALGERSRDDKRRIRPIISALRGIYFTPRGTQRVLAVISNGGTPDPEDVRDVLSDFNDAEWRVDRHLHHLDFDQTLSTDMSLRHRRELEMLSYGKRTLRREVQDVLNDTLGRNLALDAARASELLNSIEELNSLIERVEEELL